MTLELAQHHAFGVDMASHRPSYGPGTLDFLRK